MDTPTQDYLRARRDSALAAWSDGPKFYAIAREYFFSGRATAFEAERGDAGRGPWTPTLTGGRVFFADPRPDEINPAEAAYGAARVARFNGMTRGDPYSVAQHMVLGSELVRPEFALHFLVHDAHEYLAMDVPTPVKALLGPAYAAFEARLEAAVADRFGVVWTAEARAEVKRVDLGLLASEVVDLVPWGCPPAAPLLPPGSVVPLPWREAAALYAGRLNAAAGRPLVDLSALETLLGHHRHAPGANV